MDEMIQDKWAASLSYEAYRKLVQQAVAESRTTGFNQTEALAHYTKLNAQRMKRLDKTLKLNEELKALLSSLKRRYQWLVLTEGWCGDAAQLVPLMHTMAEQSEQIELRFLLRDEHDDLMQRYLTRGGRSIPKLIVHDADTGAELGSWGPRPAAAQVLVDEFKAQPEGDYAVLAERLQVWYNQDKNQQAQQELLGLLRHWEEDQA